jgi:hypothetical protein
MTYNYSLTTGLKRKTRGQMLSISTPGRHVLSKTHTSVRHTVMVCNFRWFSITHPKPQRDLLVAAFDVKSSTDMLSGG